MIINLLKDPDNYGKKNVDVQCLIVRDNRAIICIMSHLNFTARQIAGKEVMTNVRNV